MTSRCIGGPKPRPSVPCVRGLPTTSLENERPSRPPTSTARAEVDKIICWLTGYDQAGLQQQIEQETDLETFFAQAPGIHQNSALIKGVVCGVRVEEIEDPLMKKIRFLDKLIDELAKGKTMEKILRQ